MKNKRQELIKNLKLNKINKYLEEKGKNTINIVHIVPYKE